MSQPAHRPGCRRHWRNRRRRKCHRHPRNWRRHRLRSSVHRRRHSAFTGAAIEVAIAAAVRGPLADRVGSFAATDLTLGASLAVGTAFPGRAVPVRRIADGAADLGEAAIGALRQYPVLGSTPHSWQPPPTQGSPGQQVPSWQTPGPAASVQQTSVASSQRGPQVLVSGLQTWQGSPQSLSLQQVPSTQTGPFGPSQIRWVGGCSPDPSWWAAELLAVAGAEAAGVVAAFGVAGGRG